MNILTECSARPMAAQGVDAVGEQIQLEIQTRGEFPTV